MPRRKYCYSKVYGTVNVLYHFGRYSSYYGTCRNVLVYHRTCRYDGVVSNGHARQDGGMCAYPYTFSDMDGRMIKVLTVVGGKAVI